MTEVFSSKSMLPVTGVIIAQDEEKHIEKPIRNLLPNVAEVIVVDGGSKDKTVEIATELGARVEVRPFDFHFAAQRNFALGLVKTPWALWLDADEYFTEEALDLIPSLVIPAENNGWLKSGEKSIGAYAFHRVSIFSENRVDDGKDWQWRLQHTAAARWAGNIHEGLEFVAGYEGKHLPEAYQLMHVHSMQRQLFNNKLYQNINDKVNKRPEPTEGCEFRNEEGRWVDVPTDRNA